MDRNGTHVEPTSLRTMWVFEGGSIDPHAAVGESALTSCADVSHASAAGAVREQPDERQLPGVPVEEELAERRRPVPQVVHGQAPAPVLDRCGSGWHPQPVSIIVSAVRTQTFGLEPALLRLFDHRQYGHSCMAAIQGQLSMHTAAVRAIQRHGGCTDHLRCSCVSRCTVYPWTCDLLRAR